MTYQPNPNDRVIRVRYPVQYGKPQEGVLLAVHGEGAYVRSRNVQVLVPTRDLEVLSGLVEKQVDLTQKESKHRNDRQ